MEQATFGVGCFWGVETFFRDVPGVLDAVAGFAGLALAGRFKRPIVTSIEPAQTFWRAEEYHRRYLEKNGLPLCHVRMPEAT